MSRSLRILIAAVAAVAAVGGYWKLVLAPKRQQAAQLEQQLTTARAQIASAHATLATYERAKSAYRTNYATVVRLGKAAPADDDSRSLLVQLDYAAKHSGVDFSNIDVSPSGTSSAPSATASGTAPALAPGAVSAGNYAQLPFTFAFNGTYASLSNLFGRMQRFVTVDSGQIGIAGRLLRVTSIDVEPSADGGWPAIDAKIGANAYIVPAAQPLGAASASARNGTAVSAPGATGSSSTTSTATASDLR